LMTIMTMITMTGICYVESWTLQRNLDALYFTGINDTHS
jgi:hypothetical protein